MRSHSVNNLLMYQKILSLVFSLATSIVVTIPLSAQRLPDPMDPPRLVNDFSAMLDNQSVNELETKLRSFNDQTSTQIYLITTHDLLGYDISDYATRIGEEWGVGQDNKDNGIVILVKPKTEESRGEVYIAVGYGLEAVVPDLIAHRIVDYEILPRFREGAYADGLNQAVDVLISLTQGEYTAEQYQAQASGQSEGAAPGIIGIIVMIIILSAIFGGRSRMTRHQGLGKSLPFWLLLGMMNSGGRSHTGSFGDFQSGRGGFGGFGGGFGGGGGGSFGGGGAGGSW